MSRRVGDLRVSTRLAGMAGVSAVVLVVVGVMGLSAQSSLTARVNGIYDQGVKPAEAMDTLRYDVMDARLAGRKVPIALAAHQPWPALSRASSKQSASWGQRWPRTSTRLPTAPRPGRSGPPWPISPASGRAGRRLRTR